MKILETMIGKSKRNEVWNRNKPYMTGEDLKRTAEDLLPLCKNCECFKGETHDFEACRGKPCMELWLSNEYLEWVDAWRDGE